MSYVNVKESLYKGVCLANITKLVSRNSGKFIDKKALNVVSIGNFHSMVWNLASFSISFILLTWSHVDTVVKIRTFCCTSSVPYGPKVPQAICRYEYWQFCGQQGGVASWNSGLQLETGASSWMCILCLCVLEQDAECLPPRRMFFSVIILHSPLKGITLEPFIFLGTRRPADYYSSYPIKCNITPDTSGKCGTCKQHSHG